MPLPRIIINADDFGLSPRNTSSIVQCFDAGRISSTTIVANGSDFHGAVEAAKSHGFSDRVGLHAILTHGPPLSDAMGPYCDSSGYMAVPRSRVWAPEALRSAVYRELSAQVERLIEAGIRPTHIDSHEHMLNSYPLASAALKVGRRFGIPAIRLARNAFYSRGVLKSAFKVSFNHYLRTSGLRTTRWFTDFKPYFAHVRRGGAHLEGPTELMTHPAADLEEPRESMHRELDLLLSQPFEEFLRGVDLISYTDL